VQELVAAAKDLPCDDIAIYEQVFIIIFFTEYDVRVS